MDESSGDWLRVRGIGRERFAGYLADYLGTLGYAVVKGELEGNASRLTAQLERSNPALPAAAAAIAFRFYPTAGGAAVVWESPLEVPAAERGRMDRLVRELASHLERAISTESHATAKVLRPSTSRLPWTAPVAGATAAPTRAAEPSS